jgi:ABC-type spermidine/putrescine transport system permease subunit I
MRRSSAWTIFGISLVIFGIGFLLPLFRVVGGGFFADGHFTLQFIQAVFKDAIYREGLFNSVMLGLGTTFRPASACPWPGWRTVTGFHSNRCSPHSSWFP